MREGLRKEMRKRGRERRKGGGRRRREMKADVRKENDNVGRDLEM